jgi:subtilisin family serine protease
LRTLIAVLALIALAGLSPGAPGARAQVPGESPATIVIRTLTSEQRAADNRAPSLDDQGFVRVAVPPGVDRVDFLQGVRSLPGVLEAYEDVPAYAADTPNDPFYAANQAAYLSLIGAPAAWDTVTGRGSPVVVAVLDSGLDLGHPEFAGRLWENALDSTADGIDDDRNGCIDDRYGCRFVDLTSENRDGCGYTSSTRNGDVADDHGRSAAASHSHGTLVSGIIGAAGNNGEGITGVAWDVRIMVVKVLDCGANGSLPRSSGTFNVAQGIDYARRMGARVINISLATAAGDPRGDTPALRKAIEDAQADGVIMVAAAGNHAPGASQVGPGYPGAYTQYPNVVTVGSSDLAGQWAVFSNYGPALDIAAPGVSIASTVRRAISEVPYGADPDGGTSYSTPLVAGAFALLLSRNPSLPPADAIAIVQATASPAVAASHGQSWAGAGILDLADAVARVPMILTGAALRDFKDVPAGTEVRALVGGTIECGLTNVQLVGTISRYTLRVKSDAEFVGCGAPGRKVVFHVGGFPVAEEVTWGGRDESLGFVNREIGSVSPPPGAVVLQTLNGGWSNVGHFESSGLLPAAASAISSPWTQVFRWDPAKVSVDGNTGAYRRYTRDVPEFVNDMTALDRYDAFWINAGQATVAIANPNPAAGRTLQLRKGWNNIVYTGSNRAVSDALRTIEAKYQQVLQYDNATGTWQSYVPGRARYLNDFGGLFKLKVYWIFLTEAATLAMD